MYGTFAPAAAQCRLATRPMPFVQCGVNTFLRLHHRGDLPRRRDAADHRAVRLVDVVAALVEVLADLLRPPVQLAASQPQRRQVRAQLCQPVVVEGIGAAPRSQ